MDESSDNWVSSYRLILLGENERKERIVEIYIRCNQATFCSFGLVTRLTMINTIAAGIKGETEE